MIDLERIKNLIKSGKNIEDIIEKFDWREFEQIIMEIFENNNFRVRKNFRFKTRRRYEIDILAIKRNKVLCVDCKEWGRGRYKKTGLKHAIEKQEERVKELKKFLKNNPIAQNKLKINMNYEFHPLIVTWLQEDLIKENDTLIVPVWKLNSFLLELEKYL